jgi:hypothetical protein
VHRSLGSPDDEVIVGYTFATEGDGKTFCYAVDCAVAMVFNWHNSDFTDDKVTKDTRITEDS